MENLTTKLLVLQSTPFCNLDCKYCYLPDRLQKGRQETDLLKIIVENLRKEHLLEGQLSVLWHSGEPLILNRHTMQNALK